MAEWFAALRYAFVAAWKHVALAELFIASTGFGFMIQYNVFRLQLEGILAWTILFTIIMIFMEYGVIQQIEKRVFKWRSDSEVVFVPQARD